MPIFRPGKPYRVHNLSANYLPGVGLFAPAFNQFDSDGDWGPGTGPAAFEIAVPGLYLVEAHVVKGASTTAGPVEVRLLLNTVSIGRDNGDSSTTTRGAHISLVRQLELGDLVEVRADGFTTTGPLVANQSGASIVRVGPVRWT